VGADLHLPVERAGTTVTATLRVRAQAAVAPLWLALARVLSLCLLLNSTAGAAEADARTLPLLPETQSIRLEVHPHWRDERRFAILLSFDAGGRHATPIDLPTAWAGATGLGDGIRNLRSTSRATSIAPGDLPHQRRVLHPPRGTVTIAWELVEYGSAPLDHNRFYQPLLRPEYALFFGHGAWVLPSFHPQQPLRAAIALHGLPRGWTAASSFGALARGERTRWQTERIVPATLRHAVFAFGDFRLRRIDIAGQPLWLAIRGKFGFDDAEFFNRTAALVRTQRAFFGDTSFAHFLVALLPNDVARGSSGGTGVHNAFAMHASADLQVPGPDFEFLIGHENLHTWVPSRFGSMNSADGTDDEALRYWFSEGFTNFLTHRLLLASGQWSLAQYARAVSRVIRSYELSDARRRDNAAVRAQFFTDRAVGELPYQRGELLALRWDAQLRAHGQTLAGVLRSLLLPAGPASTRPSLATERLLDALTRVLGPGPRADVQRVVEQAGPIDYDAGLLGPCFVSEPVQHAHWALGFDGERSFRNRRVTGLVPGSAAQRAGLREGDLLRAYSVYGGDADRDADLTVERDGALVDIRYRPVAAAPVPGVRYRPADNADDDPACRAWLAQR